MSSPVSVESLASGNARDQIPDSQMESSGNQATTSIGAVVKQDTGVVWHKFKSEQTWGMESQTFRVLINELNTRACRLSLIDPATSDQI